ncbi:MAG: glutathione S-transferase N-terminal domain-containing protein [Pseudomonadota bacterium]
MPNPINLATSLAATTVTLPRGLMTHAAASQPELPLELYEMENCPYCRVVREALSALDIDALVYPCPKRGERYRPLVVELGGKASFPFLVDPNTGEQMYESADIIDYLYRTYGGRRPLPRAAIKLLVQPAANLASVLRAGAGLRMRPSHAPEQALELFSLESSPFARLVRERLCELELPYRLRNMGRTKAGDFIPPVVRRRLMPRYAHAGRNRKALAERTGMVQVPYLYDPNTDTGLYESDAIIAYLTETYAA